MFPADLDTILFDAGGTLVHVDYDFVVALAAEHGVAIDPTRMPHGDAAARIAIDRRLRDASAKDDSDDARVPHYFEVVLSGAGVDPAAAAELAPMIQAAHREKNLWRVPFADAADTLESLRSRGYATAVISNADGRVRGVLERADLLDHLDYVIDSFEEGVEKPDPEIFHRGVTRSGTHASRALYVGDIYTVDVLGARSAGLAACLIDPTGSYAGADCPRVASLSRLLGPLAGRQG